MPGMTGAAARPISRHASTRSPKTPRSCAAAASSPAFAALASVHGCSASTVLLAPRVLAQLGHRYGYDPTGNGGPPIHTELQWGVHAAEAGRVSAPEPLFPRLDVEVAETTG